MESEVCTISQLASISDSVWPGFACTCVELRWLALTLFKIKFARTSTQGFHRLATQPKSTQVERRQFISQWRVRLVAQRNSLHKLNLRLLVTPFGQGFRQGPERKILYRDVVDCMEQCYTKNNKIPSVCNFYMLLQQLLNALPISRLKKHNNL